MKLTQDMKDEWIANLRSGEIEQARGTWQNGKKSCCLDVLCLQLTGVHFLDRIVNTAYYPLLREVGILTDHGEMGRPQDEVRRTLQLMNDAEGKTFAEIADWIEANITPMKEDA